MKLWIDDVRPAPYGYVWAKSVNEAKNVIETYEGFIYANKKNNYRDAYEKLECLDIDHDAGKYVSDGGHYIELLKWLEETGRNYPIHIHSKNLINLLWMREIIKRNGWKEV